METSTLEVHINLRRVVGYQTHHRLREAMGSRRADILNERVFWWSLTCTTAILFVSIGQVVILRKFFSGQNVDGNAAPARLLVVGDNWTRARRAQRSLALMSEYQRHNRVKETLGRKRAESLNEMVLLWSLTVTSSILFVAVGQVMIVKRLFNGSSVDSVRASDARCRFRAMVLGRVAP